MCRLSEAELNCVSTKIFFNPELRQLLIDTSISRYFPPSGTAGLDRSFVSGKSRLPAPPARIMDRTWDGLSRLFRTIFLSPDQDDVVSAEPWRGSQCHPVRYLKPMIH